MKQELNKIKYFLYARKSSESEDRQVQSIDDQVVGLKKLANILGIFIEEIITEPRSATIPYNRPGFDNMLERIEKGEVQGILCWELNRLSRNPIESGKISWILQQGTLKCIQLIDKKYLPEDNVLLFSVESGMANQFILDLRRNTKRGMEGKADRGWLPSRAPLGYKNDLIKHIIIEDPERFHLVRKMWDMMLSGNYTVSQIKKIVNNEWGFRTVKTKRSGGTEIANSVIYNMFTNIFYTGNFKWNGRIYSNGKHKQMITLEEYDRVQVILGKKGKPRAKTHEFAYTGLIKCGVCDSMYTGIEKTKLVKNTGELKTYNYYSCTRKKNKEIHCKEKPLTLKELEEQIDIELERYTILPEFKKWALEIINQNNDNEIANRTKIYENQHKTLMSTQKELDNLTKMRYRELIDDETFIRERDELKSKITKLTNNLRDTEDRAGKWLELTEKTFNFACYARKEFILGDLRKKREIFSALGCNFSIKDRKLYITPNEWFVPIEKAYPKLKAEFNRLELDEMLDNKKKNERLAHLILEWGD